MIYGKNSTEALLPIMRAFFLPSRARGGVEALLRSGVRSGPALAQLFGVKNLHQPCALTSPCTILQVPLPDLPGMNC